VHSLLAVPISFVSEHIETLEEIDMEYRELALESGVKRWGRVPALNTNARFIEDLADAVVEALPYVGVIAGAPSGNALVPMGEQRDGGGDSCSGPASIARQLDADLAAAGQRAGRCMAFWRLAATRCSRLVWLMLPWHPWSVAGCWWQHCSSGCAPAWVNSRSSSSSSTSSSSLTLTLAACESGDVLQQLLLYAAALPYLSACWQHH
jgi:hypothetical protein